MSTHIVNAHEVELLRERIRLYRWFKVVVPIAVILGVFTVNSLAQVLVLRETPAYYQLAVIPLALVATMESMALAIRLRVVNRELS